MAEKRKRSRSPYMAEIQSVENEFDEWDSKRMKTETAPEEQPHSPQTLTEEDLRLPQGLLAMSQPKKSGNGDDTAATSCTKISIETRELLRINNLLIDDENAFDRYPRVKAKCEEAITGQTFTEMTEEEEDRIFNDLPYTTEAIEDTFVDFSWPALIRDIRAVIWRKDHLARVRNQIFNPNSIPALDPGNDKTLNDLLLSLPKLEAPKPIYCFGFREEAFTPEERVLNDCLRQYTVLSKPLYHCFFAVNFKIWNGEWGQCLTQCCRTGAAMVHATEKLLKLAASDDEHPLKDGLLRKEPCMAFTLAVNPFIAQLNVHWAEPSENGAIYHMHKMRGYFMNRQEQLKNMRHDVSCILEWGCLGRQRSIRKTLAKIKANNDVIPDASLAARPSKGGNESAADENWEHVNQGW